jgi:hypothetical protein
MRLRFIDDPSRYKIPRVLYLVRWINSEEKLEKRCYLREFDAVAYWRKRITYTESPCWIETFELSITRSNFYSQDIPQTFGEATK